MIWCLFRRECLLRYQQRSDWLNPLLFFVLVASLFPLAIDVKPLILQKLGPGIIWIALLLAIVLDLNQLFVEDKQDGTLAQALLCAHPLAILIAIKLCARCVLLLVPALLIVPVLALFYHLTLSALLVLEVTIVFGVPTLLLIGSIGAALTVGLRNSGLLLSAILVPLYIPVLIFAASAANAAQAGQSFFAALVLLMAMLMVGITLAPIVAAAALKIGALYEH